jgi:hypothetical protein
VKHFESPTPSRLPFLSTKTPQELEQKTERRRRKKGPAPYWSPHDRYLSDSYRHLENKYRLLARARSQKGLPPATGYQWAITMAEWFTLWKETIPPLPEDFLINGLQNANNPNVKKVPSYYFRSVQSLAPSALPPGVSLHPTLETIRDKKVRRAGKKEAVRRFKEEGVLSPAYKVQLKRVDPKAPFSSGNLRLVVMAMGLEKDVRTETELWPNCGRVRRWERGSLVEPE